MLDDHILKAQTMHSSAYIKPFEEEMKEWEEKLISMQVSFCPRVYGFSGSPTGCNEYIYRTERIYQIFLLLLYVLLVS